MAKSKVPYRQSLPRRITVVRCECFADPVLFLPWDQMPVDVQQEFRVNGSIPCEGGGLPGDWCAGCRFGKVHNPEDANDPE